MFFCSGVAGYLPLKMTDWCRFLIMHLISSNLSF